MTATQSKALAAPLWGKALAHSAREFSRTSLPVLSGAIPPGLQGTLYRNSAGRLERNGQRVGHWFDGDGAILAVQLSESNASATYRYVQTDEYRAESKADRWLYGNYGMLPTANLWERRGKWIKNAANTSVLALPDRLLALWEGGAPHALDLDNLETIGKDDLAGTLSPSFYSAHPKVDPQSGYIYNFGISIGRYSTLNIFVSDRTGKIVKSGKTNLPRRSYVHDFVLAGKYLLFCIPPIELQIWPILLGQKSYGESLAWKPELGTQILVIDREDLSVVSNFQVEPWFQWHFGNGCVDADGRIICELVKYANFDTNQFLREVATGETRTAALGTLWELIIDPQRDNLIASNCLVDRGCEFPIVPSSEVGNSWRYTYLNTHKLGTQLERELVGTIGRFDRHTHTLTVAELDRHLYPSEPIHAVDRDNPDRGWILSVIYDGKEDDSEVWIYDRDRLNEEPVCRLGLPSAIPPSFHGTWCDRH